MARLPSHVQCVGGEPGNKASCAMSEKWRHYALCTQGHPKVKVHSGLEEGDIFVYLNDSISTTS